MSIRRSLALSAADKYSSLAIQFLTSIVLARLLSPEDIGIFSVGSVAATLSHTLRDFGVTNYLIQEKELTAARIQSAQGITLIIGWGLGLLLLLLSMPIAIFYKEPGVQQILSVLAINFFLLPFGSITAALLRREMRFDLIYRINFLSALAQSATSISLALLGNGFMSLAWGALASAIFATSVSFFYRRPGQPWWPAFKESRRVMSTSARFSAASLFYEMGFTGPDLISGKLLGFEATGFLSRATGAVQLVHRALLEAVYPVAMPYFAESARGGADLTVLFERSCALMTGIAWPGFAVLAIGAEPIITLLFGVQWTTSILPTRILCGGMAMLTLASISSSIATAMGQAQLVLELLVKYQLLKLVLVMLGAIWELPGVAVGAAVGDAILGVVYLRRICDLIGLRVIVLLKSLLSSVIVTIATCAGAFAGLRIIMDNDASLVRMLGLVTGALLGWVAGVWLASHPIRLELNHLFHHLIGDRK